MRNNKECRNFRRRRAYQNPTDSDDPILPLNEHNRHFLLSVLGSKSKETLIDIDLKTLKPAEVLYKRERKNILHLTLKVPGGAEYDHIHRGLKEDFIDFVLPLLSRLQIRLFHPADSNALKGIRWLGTTHNIEFPRHCIYLSYVVIHNLLYRK